MSEENEFKMEEYTDAPIYNEHGSPTVCLCKGKYYFVLDDWRGHSKVEISKEFYDVFVKEFGKND